MSRACQVAIEMIEAYTNEAPQDGRLGFRFTPRERAHGVGEVARRESPRFHFPVAHKGSLALNGRLAC